MRPEPIGEAVPAHLGKMAWIPCRGVRAICGKGAHTQFATSIKVTESHIIESQRDHFLHCSIDLLIL
jgi:hypothetical protein